jgi:excisionase family DNA binding protein
MSTPEDLVLTELAAGPKRTAALHVAAMRRNVDKKAIQRAIDKLVADGRVEFCGADTLRIAEPKNPGASPAPVAAATASPGEQQTKQRQKAILDEIDRVEQATAGPVVEWITTRQAAEILGCGVSTIRYLAEKHKLTRFKDGEVHTAAVKLQRREVEALVGKVELSRPRRTKDAAAPQAVTAAPPVDDLARRALWAIGQLVEAWGRSAPPGEHVVAAIAKLLPASTAPGEHAQ